VDVPAKAGRRIEAIRPRQETVEAVLRIARTAGLDLCGVEYLESDRDGQLYFYDINALSNFVAEPQRILGFDPFVNLANYLEREAAYANDAVGLLAQEVA
jgi:glutathione synthase/RimK-type ligase-like ATP-grasp enzyme